MVAPLIVAGGMGLLNGLFGGGSGKPQTTTSSIDPQSQDYIRQMRAMAMQFAGRPMPGLDPSFLAALQNIQGYGGYGLDAMKAMSSPEGMSSAMNPYLASMNPIFDQMRASALNTYNKSATMAGAFGARRDLGAGAAMNDVNQAQTQAAFNAFESLRNNLMARAGLGFNASQALGGMGQYMTDRQRNYDIGSLGLIAGGYGGPLSTTNSTPTEKGSFFQRFLGGAMAGYGMAGGKFGGGASAPMTPPEVPQDMGQWWQNFLGQ